MAWYMVTMRHVAARKKADYSVGGIEAVLRMWIWLAPSSRSRIDDGFMTDVLDSWWVMGVVGMVLGFVLGLAFN